jgi:hypothetical protein
MMLPSEQVTHAQVEILLVAAFGIVDDISGPELENVHEGGDVPGRLPACGELPPDLNEAAVARTSTVADGLRACVESISPGPIGRRRSWAS